MAFKVGAVGSIILGLAALLGDTLAWLAALAVWSLVILFVLPWLYVAYCKKNITIPYYALKGPHQ